jgi:acyltransferase
MRLVDKQRINWVDIAKGLGIILVVVGHTKFGYVDFIYSFHMPLFFIISGLLFTSSKCRVSFKDFLADRFKRLIIPYFASCIFFYTFWVLLGRHFGENAEKNVPVLKPLLGMLYANGINDWLIFNVPLWFLPCLFVAELIFFISLKLYKNNNGMLATAVLVITISGYFISRVLFLPWGADIALVSQLFIFIGYQIRDKNLYTRVTINQVVALVVFLAVMLLISYYINGRVDMNGRIYKNFLLFYMGGVSGSILIFVLSRTIGLYQKISVFFTNCGKETLIILFFHSISFKVLSAIVVFLLHMPLKFAQQQLWMIYSLVGVLSPMYLGFVVKESRITRKMFYPV